MKLKLEVKGNRAIFKNATKEIKKDLENEILMTTEAVADQAQVNTPSNTGFLRNSITAEVDGLEGVVRVGAKYGPFIEFGTGTLVDAPAEWEQYASEFKGKLDGTFEQFENSLKDWMRNKGIPEEAFFPIAMKILRVGIRPQPFLYPAFKAETTKMIERLKKKYDSK